jgi:hypothetical protein
MPEIRRGSVAAGVYVSSAPSPSVMSSYERVTVIRLVHPARRLAMRRPDCSRYCQRGRPLRCDEEDQKLRGDAADRRGAYEAAGAEPDHGHNAMGERTEPLQHQEPIVDVRRRAALVRPRDTLAPRSDRACMRVLSALHPRHNPRLSPLGRRHSAGSLPRGAPRSRRHVVDRLGDGPEGALDLVAVIPLGAGRGRPPRLDREPILDRTSWSLRGAQGFAV